ncbi:hypothetical protein E1A91_D06G155600v1 [Gossypium mustelinum]|uniref:Uncharacterized protein n=2 Tax=Gossypium TaxID=3633 RepID=A0A5D2ULZ8_GOSMU|nr:hypothetical protein ES332_D06G166700v1 [Gossypium tomentosum]TYI77640.1 hypothetical protein E1A91_D06G155600v1 [Gossypium mustelinum]
MFQSSAAKGQSLNPCSRLSTPRIHFGHVSSPANLLLYRLCILGIRLWNIRQIVILTFSGNFKFYIFL